MSPSERNFTLHELWIVCWKLQTMWADLEFLCCPFIRQLSHIRSTMTRTLQALPIVISPIGCPRSPPSHVTKCYWLVTLASLGIKVRCSCCMGFSSVQLIALCLLLWPLWSGHTLWASWSIEYQGCCPHLGGVSMPSHLQTHTELRSCPSREDRVPYTCYY